MNLKSIFKGYQNIAGVDEVGRGSLIGPVYASAVILKKNCDVKKLKDSKKLTKKEREVLNKYIKKNSYWSIGSASKEEIEKLNILNASLLAMKRAIKKLKKKPRLVLVDGNRIPVMKNYNLKYVIKGDQKIPQISAASIVLKFLGTVWWKKYQRIFQNINGIKIVDMEQKFIFKQFENLVSQSIIEELSSLYTIYWVQDNNRHN